jgi:hypothetical protein
MRGSLRFCFGDEIQPAPPGKVSQRTSTEYMQWLAQVTQTYDFRHGGLNVRVTDEDGKLLRDATVSLTGPRAASGTTDSEGVAYFFGVPTGVYVVHARRQGHDERFIQVNVPLKDAEKDVKSLAPDGVTALGVDKPGPPPKKPPKKADEPGEPVATVVLPKALRLVVTVRDVSGAPAPELTVRASGIGIGPKPAVATTDDTGRAEFKLSSEGSLDIEVKGAYGLTSGKASTTWTEDGVTYAFVMLGAPDWQPKHRYMWQNRMLRQQIYPARNKRLRDFCTTYKSLALQDPANRDPQVLKKIKADRLAKEQEVKAQKTVVAAKEAEIKQQQAVIDKLGASKKPEDVEKRKDAISKRNELLAEKKLEEAKLKELQAELNNLPTEDKAALIELSAYKNALQSWNHDQLMSEVLAWFQKDPACSFIPKWVRYMVVHFSGMRYKSAHCSFAPPRDLLTAIRSEETREHCLTVAPPRLREYAREARRLHAERKYPKKFAISSDSISLSDAELGNPKNTKAAKLRENVGEIYARFAADELKKLSDPAILGLFVSRDPTAAVPLSRMFDTFLWRFVVALSKLRHDQTIGSWEPSDADYSAALWQIKDPSAGLRALRSIAAGGTLWKAHHRRTLDPIVTRAVCNQIDEISLHAREVPDSQLRSLGGLTDNAIDYARHGGLRSLASMTDVQPGGSFFFAKWQRVIPKSADPKDKTDKNPWRQNRWSTVNPETPLVMDRGDGKPIPVSGSGYHYAGPAPGDKVPFDYSYTIDTFEGAAKDPDDHLLASAPVKWHEYRRTVRIYSYMPANPADPLYTPKPTKPGDADTTLDVLVWDHQAAIVHVDQNRTITFETREEGAGINERDVHEQEKWEKRDGPRFSTYGGRLPAQQVNSVKLDAFLDPTTLLASEPD